MKKSYRIWSFSFPNLTPYHSPSCSLHIATPAFSLNLEFTSLIHISESLQLLSLLFRTTFPQTFTGVLLFRISERASLKAVSQEDSLSCPQHTIFDHVLFFFIALTMHKIIYVFNCSQFASPHYYCEIVRELLFCLQLQFYWLELNLIHDRNNIC